MRHPHILLPRTTTPTLPTTVVSSRFVMHRRIRIYNRRGISKGGPPALFLPLEGEARVIVSRGGVGAYVGAPTGVSAGVYVNITSGSGCHN